LDDFRQLIFSLQSPPGFCSRGDDDRVFAVPRRSHAELGLRDVRDLSTAIRQELEKFFIATDELVDKRLRILGWKGPKAAMKTVAECAKAFEKK
jgi:inorganic pyrophosphatase